MNATLSAYIINLPSSGDRRKRMEAQCAAIGLSHRFVSAINGKMEWDRLAGDLDEVAFRRNVGRPVLAGEIGCYHSHLLVWKMFLASGDDIALILEDDVVFHDDFFEAIDAAMAEKDAWDFLKLNKIRAKQPICQRKAGEWRINAYLGPATGMGAYLIKKDLAERLLPAMLPVTRPIDHEVDRIFVHDYRYFGLEPFPSHVDDHGSSTITGKNFTAVKKFPWYRRLPMYGLRWSNQFKKIFYFLKKGWFRTRS